MVIELSGVQFWSEIILVISNRTRAARSFDFEITRMISDQIALHQEKMRDREGDAQSSPWDILISVKLFLDGTKTEVCFPRGPQSQQARVVLNIHQQPLHNAISTSSDEFI